MEPKKIGRYEIERELGQGGMAVVYLARDPYMTRRVAVKVLPRQFTFNPQFITRFRREAQLIATLEHAFIVPVYDFGEDDGQPFIVMRYMLAGSLERYLPQGALPVSDAVHIFERICEALDAAHERGILHRDLKPANILLDDRGQAYLGDFGLATIAESGRSSLGKNYMIGTPAYMSPEQGLGKDLDARSDVYALGAILFEMLAARLPFPNGTALQLMMQHVHDPVPSLVSLNPKLSPAIEAIVHKAMAKDRQARYATAGELADALSEAARGMPSRRARKRWMWDEVDEKLRDLGGEG